MSTPRYYVYVLARPDGTPFYVGKGSGRRLYKHEVEARRGCRCHKCCVIRKVWKSRGEILRYIVFTTDNESDAYDMETDTILLYGLSTLTNRNAGGERGVSPKPEVRARLAAINKAKWTNPDLRARMEAAIRARSRSPEWRSRLSELMKTRMADPEARARLSEAAKRQQRSNETLKRFSEATSKKWKDEEMRAKMKAGLKAAWADPEVRARRIAAMKAARRKDLT